MKRPFIEDAADETNDRHVVDHVLGEQFLAGIGLAGRLRSIARTGGAAMPPRYEKGRPPQAAGCGPEPASRRAHDMEEPPIVKTRGGVRKGQVPLQRQLVELMSRRIHRTYEVVLVHRAEKRELDP